MTQETKPLNAHLTYEEGRALIDRDVRHILGFSLTEYVRRRDEGTLPDHPERAYLEVMIGDSDWPEP